MIICRIRNVLELFLLIYGVMPLLNYGQDYQKGAVDTEQAIAELVSGETAVQPGQTIDVALRLQLDPHWHVYWKNPGDTGLAPSIDWEVPDGIEVGELEFPTPEKIITSTDFVSYGYQGEVFFLAKVTIPEDFGVGQTISLNADASWLACEQMCIPGGAKLALELPVSGESADSSQWGVALKVARANIPKTPDGAVLTFEALESTISASIDWAGFNGIDTKSLYFYPEEEGLINSATDQNFVLTDFTLIVSMQTASNPSSCADWPTSRMPTSASTISASLT